ncbi:hypothetical protein LP422_13795 [Janibacter limosus]|uniref:Uncharacterized protein n=1 Tax=Janibacter limosus TaxID=53458 RepID=A0AC61U1D5_9MICO|nr:hypothetical protein [Janibacter limosus]UUZ43824.1 hypothetical protein LP422_13795 [Janibacter limosus]
MGSTSSRSSARSRPTPASSSTSPSGATTPTPPGQSFGIIGLERAGTDPTPASVDFLLAQQCDDGGFSPEFKDECVSDPDATSTAVQALDLVGGHDAQVQSAADYLESRQDGSGGVGGGATTEGVNANSTGLAATALRIAGRDDAGAQALAYLDTLTFGCATPALAGAVAYNRADFDAAVAKGATAAPDGTITRSTARALLGADRPVLRHHHLCGPERGHAHHRLRRDHPGWRHQRRQRRRHRHRRRRRHGHRLRHRHRRG